MNRIWFSCIMFLIVFGAFYAIETESEFEDTPYFTGIPSYKIIDALDQEFADYRFYNGKNRIMGEGNELWIEVVLFNGVVSAIVAQGIDAKRLSFLWHGQDKPIADNTTEEGRAKNRRVELV